MEPQEAVLKLCLVGDIAGRFRVPRYQRGHRWGELEVTCLLNRRPTQRWKVSSSQTLLTLKRRLDHTLSGAEPVLAVFAAYALAPNI